MFRKFRRAHLGHLVLASTISTALLFSSCGSEDEAGAAPDADSPEAKACVDKANEFLKSWREFPTALPDSPPARYTQLPEVPPTGKHIILIRQNFPAGESTFKGVEDGAEALGWTAESVVFDNTLPDFLAKYDSAIAAKPDFIMSSGFPAAAFQKQVDAAKAAGINVIVSSTTDKAVESPGLAGSGNTDKTNALIAQVHANMALADSGCHPDTVIFTLDYPVIKAAEESYKSTIEDNCSSCKVEIVTIQAKDIGTPAMTQQMVAKLQAEPSIKYAYTMIGDMGSGLAQSLKTAQIDDVNIFGQVPNETSIADLRAGTNAWWVLQSSYVNGVDMDDMAARVAVTGEPQGDPGGYPLALLTKDNVPDGDGVPVIPADILDLYKATWGVS